MFPAFLRGLASTSLVLMLTACGGSGSNSNDASLRFLNASDDYPSLDLYVDGTRHVAAQASGTVSASEAIAADTYTLSLRAADGTTTLHSASRTFGSATPYTVVAYGSDGNLRSLLLADSEDAPSSGSAKLRVINAAPEAGSLDAYISDSCATTSDFGNAAAIATSLGGGSVGAYTETGAGTLCLRITGAGDTSDLRLAISSLTLASQEVVTVLLTPGSGGVLVHALRITQAGTVASQRNGYARARVVAAVDGNGAVTASVGSQTLTSAIRSPAVGGYTLVTAGTPAMAVSVDGTALATGNLSASAGSDYTLLVTGASGSSAQLAVLSDDNRKPSSTNTARVRLVHALPSASSGTLSLTANYSVAADAVSFASASAYTTLATSSDVALEVGSALASDPLFSDTAVSLDSQAVYTLFMLGGNTTPKALLRKDR